MFEPEQYLKKFFPHKRLTLEFKLTFLTKAMVLAMVVCTSLAVIVGAILRSTNDIQAYRTESLGKTQEALKNYIDIAYATMENTYRQLMERYIRENGGQLKAVINQADAILKAKANAVREGSLTLSQAQAAALAEIKQIRYANGAGYVWVNDMARPIPRMIMHPTLPKLDGTVLDDPKFNCALGVDKNLFVAILDACEKEGSGFVDYLWPKPIPGGLTAERPKLSYVRQFSEWGWIIGTGSYVESGLNETAEIMKNQIRIMRYSGGTGYIWINDMAKPFPHMIMHPTSPALEGQVMDSPKYNCAQGIKRSMFLAFCEVGSQEGGGFVDYLWPKPSKDGLTTEQPKLSYVRKFKPLNWIIGTGVYIDDIDTMVAQKSREIWLHQLILIIMIVVPMILISFLALVVLIRLIKSLTHTIGGLNKKFEEISAGEGDLSKRMDMVGEDEISELARSFNLFLDKLSNLIGTFKKTSARMDRSSRDMAEMGQGLIESSDSLDMKVKNLKQNIGELNRNVATTSAATEQSSANLSNVDQSVREYSQTINHISNNAAKTNSVASDAVEVVNNASKKISVLIAKTAEINSIVNAISDISSQTKLLALNASIEAARAGESGRGFSVVADEVKKLAGEVNKAAIDIREILKNMQGATADSIAELEKINKVMVEVNDAITDIAASVEEQTSTTMSISGNISEAVGGLDNVNEAIAGVVGLSNKIEQDTVVVSEESQHVMEEGSILHKQSKELLDLSETIQSLVGRFKIREN